MPIKYNVPFDDYKQMPGLNASLLAASLGSWADFQWQFTHEVEVDPNVTRVGTAAHSIVEYLPQDKFMDFYCVAPPFETWDEVRKTDGSMPDRPKSTAAYRRLVAEFKETETRTVLSRSEYDRLNRIIQGISGNPEAMELIKAANREVTVTGNLAGHNCKGLVDGLIGTGASWDLKTCHSVDERAFSGVARRLRYLFKDTFRTMLLNTNGCDIIDFKYIVVLDEKVKEGSTPKHAPTCVIVDVPFVAIENYMTLVHDKLHELSRCIEMDNWPGMDGYQLQLDSWDMPEVTLVD
jgi:hypothetical protein